MLIIEALSNAVQVAVSATPLIIGAGGMAYAAATIYSKKAEAEDKVSKEADNEASRLIGMLKEQRDFYSDKVDQLSGKVDSLTTVVMEFACRNAPFCPNRSKPDGCIDCAIKV